MKSMKKKTIKKKKAVIEKIPPEAEEVKEIIHTNYEEEPVIEEKSKYEDFE